MWTKSPGWGDSEEGDSEGVCGGGVYVTVRVYATDQKYPVGRVCMCV